MNFPVMHHGTVIGQASTQRGALSICHRKLVRTNPRTEGFAAKLVVENLGPDITGEPARVPVGCKFWAVGTILSHTYGLKPGADLRR